MLLTQNMYFLPYYFFLPFKENLCRDIRRKIFEFSLESSNLVVHSGAPLSAEGQYEPCKVLDFILPPYYLS